MASRAAYASVRPSREIAGPPFPDSTWPGGSAIVQPRHRPAAAPAAGASTARRRRQPTPRRRARASPTGPRRRREPPRPRRRSRPPPRRATPLRRGRARASPMSRSRCFASRSRQRPSSVTHGERASSAGSAVQSGSVFSTAASTSLTVSPSKSRRPRQHLEEHDAEGPDVGALVDRLAARLLGRHVGRGAEDQAGRGAGVGERRRLREVGGRSRAGAVAGPGLGEAEVEHLDLAVRASRLTFAGLRSRWTMPFSCASSSASAICFAIGDRLVDGNRRRASAARRGLRPRRAPWRGGGRRPVGERRALEAVDGGRCRGG